MKLSRDDAALWAAVTATVRPMSGKRPPAPPVIRREVARQPTPPRLHRAPARAPDLIEPRRFRRMTLGREPIGARLDLHGLGQTSARAALVEFIAASAARGLRGVVVITGKGVQGDGILRRCAPGWLAEPPMRAMVAGVSEAPRRHGGAGALYVALKRRARVP